MLLEKYFIYENKNKDKIFCIKNNRNFIEEFNLTYYDFKEEDFNNFVNIEKLDNELIQEYKQYYKVKSLLGIYLLIYLGY